MSSRKMTGPFTDQEITRFEKVLADPDRYPSNRGDRERFREWAGDRFTAWYQRGHALAEAKDAAGTGDDGLSEVRFFESNWHLDGPMAYYDQKRVEDTLEWVRTSREEGAYRVVRELVRALDGRQDASAADILGIVAEWAARHTPDEDSA